MLVPVVRVAYKNSSPESSHGGTLCRLRSHLVLLLSLHDDRGRGGRQSPFCGGAIPTEETAIALRMTRTKSILLQNEMQRRNARFPQFDPAADFARCSCMMVQANGVQPRRLAAENGPSNARRHSANGPAPTAAPQPHTSGRKIVPQRHHTASQPRKILNGPGVFLSRMKHNGHYRTLGVPRYGGRTG